MSQQQVQLMLTVIDYDRMSSWDPIGEVILGCNLSSTELRHWVNMLASPRRPISQWHTLKEPENADDNDYKFDRFPLHEDTHKIKEFLKELYKFLLYILIERCIASCQLPSTNKYS